MSSSRWLTSEVRWAREQQSKIERQIADLRDDRELGHERAKAENEIQRVKWRFRADMRAALERRTALTAEGLPEAIGKLETDAARWRQLADEYTDRIVRDEDAALFETGDAS